MALKYRGLPGLKNDNKSLKLHQCWIPHDFWQTIDLDDKES